MLSLGEDVVGLDNMFSTDRRAIDALCRHGSFQLVEGDVADADCVDRAFRLSQADVVYLLAAQSSAHPDAAPPDYTERTNLVGPRVVVEACQRHGVERLVFGSSLRVYGQPLPPRFDESTSYGRQRDLSHLSKVYAEKLLEMHGVGVSARLPIVFGLAPVMKRNPRFMTVPNLFAWQARQGETLKVNPGAGAVQLIHVDDAVRALMACAELAALGPANVLAESTSLGDLARCVATIGRERGLDVRCDVPDEPPPKASVGSSRLVFTPRRSLDEGMRELIDYFLADRT